MKRAMAEEGGRKKSGTGFQRREKAFGALGKPGEVEFSVRPNSLCDKTVTRMKTCPIGMVSKECGKGALLDGGTRISG
jgi:hypothetical protein